MSFRKSKVVNEPVVEETTQAPVERTEAELTAEFEALINPMVDEIVEKGKDVADALLAASESKDEVALLIAITDLYMYQEVVDSIFFKLHAMGIQYASKLLGTQALESLANAALKISRIKFALDDAISELEVIMELGGNPSVVVLSL